MFFLKVKRNIKRTTIICIIVALLFTLSSCKNETRVYCEGFSCICPEGWLPYRAENLHGGKEVRKDRIQLVQGLTTDDLLNGWERYAYNYILIEKTGIPDGKSPDETDYEAEGFQRIEIGSRTWYYFHLPLSGVNASFTMVSFEGDIRWIVSGMDDCTEHGTMKATEGSPDLLAILKSLREEE